MCSLPGVRFDTVTGHEHLLYVPPQTDPLVEVKPAVVIKRGAGLAKGVFTHQWFENITPDTEVVRIE